VWFYHFNYLCVRQRFGYDAQHAIAIFHINTPALYGGVVIKQLMQQLLIVIAADVGFK